MHGESPQSTEPSGGAEQGGDVPAAVEGSIGDNDDLALGQGDHLDKLVDGVIEHLGMLDVSCRQQLSTRLHGTGGEHVTVLDAQQLDPPGCGGGPHVVDPTDAARRMFSGETLEYGPAAGPHVFVDDPPGQPVEAPDRGSVVVSRDRPDERRTQVWKVLPEGLMTGDASDDERKGVRGMAGPERLGDGPELCSAQGPPLVSAFSTEPPPAVATVGLGQGRRREHGDLLQLAGPSLDDSGRAFGDDEQAEPRPQGQGAEEVAGGEGRIDDHAIDHGHWQLHQRRLVIAGVQPEGSLRRLPPGADRQLAEARHQLVNVVGGQFDTESPIGDIDEAIEANGVVGGEHGARCGCQEHRHRWVGPCRLEPTQENIVEEIGGVGRGQACSVGHGGHDQGIDRGGPAGLRTGTASAWAARARW